MVQITDKVYAVEVPEGSIGHQVVQTRPATIVMHFYVQCGYIENKSETIVLPSVSGTYHFLFTTKTATEEDARKVAGLQHHNFKEWFINFEGRNYFTEAIPSLHSLLRSKGLDPENNFALIEKLK